MKLKKKKINLMDCKKRERDFRQFLFFWGRDVRHVKVIFFFFFFKKENKYNENFNLWILIFSSWTNQNLY